MNSIAFYDRISGAYPLINRFLKANKNALISAVNSLPKGELLEIGVGQGSYLKQYKEHRITGIDQSEKMLELSRKEIGEKANLLKMNAEQLDFPDAHFDIIVLSHVLSIQKQPIKVLNECHRVLKRDGKIFVLNHFTPDNLIAVADFLFQPFATLLHFNSYFKIDQLTAFKGFNISAIQNLGKLGYFKLVTLEKK